MICSTTLLRSAQDDEVVTKSVSAVGADQARLGQEASRQWLPG